jgi:hypothetical protein
MKSRLLCQEKFGDTKVVIRSYKLKMDRQDNGCEGQEDKQWSTKSNK